MADILSDYQVRQLENKISDLKEELAMFKERCLQQERLIHELQKRPIYMPTFQQSPDVFGPTCGTILCQN
jgi:hypothetical protein